MEKNESLARDRQAAVENILDDELGKPKWASARVRGENEYATDDKRREASEQALRRSMIWFEETVNQDVPTEIVDVAEHRRAEEEAAIKRQLERSKGGAAIPSPRP